MAKTAWLLHKRLGTVPRTAQKLIHMVKKILIRVLSRSCELMTGKAEHRCLFADNILSSDARLAFL